MDPFILQFLAELKENNNRDWFTANKYKYVHAKDIFDAFINELIPEIRSFDPLLDLITARDCTFRIYRDVRFSKDKSPYKPNMGAYIARGGKGSRLAGYYVHVEPGQSFLAGGIYMPQADVLKMIREEIYYNVEEFKQIIYNPKFKSVYGMIDDPTKLINAPKGFDKDFADIELLKYKSYAVMHSVPDSLISGEDYIGYAVKTFKELYPLNNFFNRIFIE